MAKKRKGKGGGGPGGGKPGGGKGGPSRISPRERRLRKDQIKLAQSQITFELGGKLPPRVMHIIHKGIVNGWTIDQILVSIQSTQWFTEAFPGIQPGMKPGAYRELAGEYSGIASEFGIGSLSKATLGGLIAGGVSLNEFSDRMRALQSYQENLSYFNEFVTQAQAAGMDTRTLQASPLDFFMGSASPEFYRLWERSTIGGAAGTYGLDLSEADIDQIIGAEPGLVGGTAESAAELQLRFSELAKQVRTTIPLGRIHSFDITMRDLIELEFGGPQQAAIAERVQRILASEQGLYTEKATSQLTPRGAPRERPQSL